jgi:putative transposase
VHEKVANQRKDFLHKTANYYVGNYGLIAVEDLNIKGMVKNHHLAKSISDSSWAMFFDMLSWKAEEAARTLIKVPRFEPTSKICSECGSVKYDLTLRNRQWVCRSCGALHDRDFNAAKNIKRVGQTLQAQTCGSSQSVACESRSN